ncbi:MAG: hypothetical protein PVSMB4_07960 [Ktedonobacterales bacterium]
MDVKAGARLEISGGDKPYAQVAHDTALALLYQRNAEALGRRFMERGESSASTDMGNVSQVLPTIHPSIGINSLPAVNHQPEFAAHCATPDADAALLDGALAMAWTAIDIAADASLRASLMARA